jgi:predicted RNase H-like nuclease (RuvC/YqgF family)
MEMIPFDSSIAEDIKFINFCTAAFHQIENLLNYFYWKRFDDNMTNIVDFLYDSNPNYKRKKIQTRPYNKKLSQLPAHLKTYAFEKEFFFDKQISYDKSISLLREARNDDSHRCQVETLNIEQVKKDYSRIKEMNKAFLDKHKKFRPLSNAEEKIKMQYKLIRLLEVKDYKRVRKILLNVVDEIKKYRFSLKLEST